MRKSLGDKLASLIADASNKGGSEGKVRNAYDFISNKSYDQ